MQNRASVAPSHADVASAFRLLVRPGVRISLVKWSHPSAASWAPPLFDGHGEPHSLQGVEVESGQRVYRVVFVRYEPTAPYFAVATSPVMVLAQAGMLLPGDGDHARRWHEHLLRRAKGSGVARTTETVDLPNGRPFTVETSTLPDMIEASLAALDAMERDAATAIGEDGHSLVVKGRLHTFTHLQAAVVRALWDARAAGVPAMSEEALGTKAGSSAERFRVDATFAGHDALGTVVIRAGKGSWRLAGEHPKK